ALHRHDRQPAQAHRVFEGPRERGRRSGAARARAFAGGSRHRGADPPGNRGIRGGGDDRRAAQRYAVSTLDGVQAESPPDDLNAPHAHAPMIAGLILAAGDSTRMGTVTAEAIRALLAAFRTSTSPVVIPTFKGQRGHPVLIGRALFDELLGLSPEAGANTVIRKYRNATQFVEVGDAGILLDVDDPETYRSLARPGGSFSSA